MNYRTIIFMLFASIATLTMQATTYTVTNTNVNGLEIVLDRSGNNNY